MATSNPSEDLAMQTDGDHQGGAGAGATKLFTLKKWNAVAMWSWDVECDTCAICRVQVQILLHKTFEGQGQIQRLCIPRLILV